MFVWPLLALAVACGPRGRADSPSIVITTVPEAAAGGADRLGRIAGRVTGAGGGRQVVLYASRLDLSLENQNLKSLLDGMHWRVMELEKVCSRMKTQMTKMKSSRRRAARSLPKMCS
jgi:hypothetical protein